ncbi:MAG: hypothetical protein HYV40_02260 [Candidatus Levybacteria bacterium]|nr:hypothetical protein [Candidatus Levybacteria bacterium]
MPDFGSEQQRPPENDIAQRRQVQRADIFTKMPDRAAKLIEGERYSSGLIPKDRPHLYANYDPITGDRIRADIYEHDINNGYWALAGKETPDLYYRNPFPDLLGLASTASGSAEAANSFGFLVFSPYFARINRNRSSVEHHTWDFLKTTKGNPQPSPEAAELARKIARRMKEVDAQRAPDDRRTELIEIYQEFYSPQSADFQKNAPYLAEAYLLLALDPNQDPKIREKVISKGNVLRFGRKGPEAPLQIFAPNASYWERVDASWVDENIGKGEQTHEEKNRNAGDGAHYGFNGNRGREQRSSHQHGYNGGSKHQENTHAGSTGGSSGQQQEQSSQTKQEQETSEQMAERLLGVTPGLIASLPPEAKQAAQKFAAQLALAAHPDKIAQLPLQMRTQAEKLAHGAIHIINETRGK